MMSLQQAVQARMKLMSSNSDPDMVKVSCCIWAMVVDDRRFLN